MKKIFYLSAALLFLTFMMIILGGIVKNSGSSLACPDWPTCHGTLTPTMEGGVAIEHSHRLLGSLIGILTILLTALAFRVRKTDRLVFRGAVLALVLVIIQGVLGGLTVLSGISAALSSVHLGLSHIFFGTILFVYYKSCAYCEDSSLRLPRSMPQKFERFALGATILVFVQICLGGIVRHFGAGPACGLGWSNALLCQDLVSGDHTLWPANGPGQLNMLHRLNGVLVLFAIIGLTIPLLKFARIQKLTSLRRLLISIHVVVTLQVLIGIKVIGTFIAPWAITLHLAFGLSLWALILSVFIKIKTRGLPPGSLERSAAGI